MNEGWVPKRLGTAVTLIMGQAPAGADCNREGNGTPFVKVGEFGEQRPIVREWTTDPKKMARSTDVLICVVGATCGKINLGADCAIGRSVAAIRPKPEKIDQRYLWYFMQGKVQEMRQGSQGAAQTVINREMIKELAIPLPPLDEQRRIVAVLDKAFAGIATATANAQKNLTNARFLFEAILQTVFTGSDEKWIKTRLGEICGLQNGFAFQSGTFQESGIPVLRISNIQNETIEARRLVYVNPGDYREDLTKFKVGEGALLIAMSGATTGKVGILEENRAYYLNQRVGKFEPSAQLDKRYLFYFLITKADENLSISAGSAQPNLSTAQIKEFLIPLPPIDQQAAIAERFANARAECGRLKAIAERKLAALSEFKQSLLQKAFAGELT